MSDLGRGKYIAKHECYPLSFLVFNESRYGAENEDGKSSSCSSGWLPGASRRMKELTALGFVAPANLQ